MRAMGGVPVMAAVLVFVLAAALFASTVVGSVRVGEPLETGMDGGPATVSSSESATDAEEIPGVMGSPWDSPYPQVTADEILSAVNQDLFKPDRTPPRQRYLLPSERAAPVRQSRDDRRRRTPDMKVVGTALAGNLALALVQVEDTVPLAFALGEMVEGYTVAAVTQENVLFLRDDDELVLPVVEPDRDRRRDRGRDRGRNSNDDNNNDQAQQFRQGLQQIQQLLRQGRGGGGAAVLPGAAIRLNNAIRVTPGVIRGTGPGGGTVQIRRGGGGGGRP